MFIKRSKLKEIERTIREGNPIFTRSEQKRMYKDLIDLREEVNLIKQHLNIEVYKPSCKLKLREKV